MRKDIHSYLFQRIKLEKAPYSIIDPCWIWTGGAYNGTHNYGGVRAYEGSPRKYRVHRITFQLFKGFLSNTDILLHACDRPRCCNPAHLSVGTHSQNIQDYYLRIKNPSLKVNA
jgi:hypothetical protein